MTPPLTFKRVEQIHERSHRAVQSRHLRVGGVDQEVLIGRAAHRAQQTDAVHMLRHSFCSHLGNEGGAAAGDSGTSGPRT